MTGNIYNSPLIRSVVCAPPRPRSLVIIAKALRALGWLTALAVVLASFWLAIEVRS